MSTFSCRFIKANSTKVPQNLLASQRDQDQTRKRKRAQEQNELPTSAPTTRLRKRQRTSGASSVVGNAFCQPAAEGVAESKISPVAYWVEKETWPKEFFEQDDQTRKDFDKDSWFDKYWVPEMSMNHLLARKKSSSSLRGKRSEGGSDVPSSKTPSDQKAREVKSAPYQDVRYKTILETKGSFMVKSKLGILDASKSLCQTIFDKEQTVPQESLFRDDIFDKTCEKIQDRNEARVVQDITRLIVPSAETLATYGAEHLEILVESVNEGWNNAIPMTKTRPQHEKPAQDQPEEPSVVDCPARCRHSYRGGLALVGCATSASRGTRLTVSSTEDVGQLVHAAALCSKAVYGNGTEPQETPNVPGHAVRRKLSILPSTAGTLKASAIFEVEKTGSGPRTTNLIVAIRGSAGIADWLVNFDNELSPCPDILVCPPTRAPVHAHQCILIIPRTSHLIRIQLWSTGVFWGVLELSSPDSRSSSPRS
jgi:hypothetical protein